MPLVDDALSIPFNVSAKLAGSAQTITSLTQSQFLFLLMCYVPFLLVPSIMMVDMAFRVSKWVGKGIEAEKRSKKE